MTRLVWLLLVVGCTETPMTPRSDAGTDAGTDAEVPIDAFTPDVALPDAGADTSTPDALDCVYASDSFGTGMQQLDSGPEGASLVFTIAGLPDPALIDSATLVFTSHDADHPGQEGVIEVNSTSFDLPAMAAWDNSDQTNAVDVLAAIVEGDNRIEFGPGPLERSFFRIGDVELSVRARVDECEIAPPPPPPPPADAVVRSMHYTEASYTNRRTWVVPCRGANPLRDYAFTASGDEHVDTDCSGEFIPGGNRRGTAVFRFEDVVEARYRVVIRSRHTENRNPAGALFVIEGEERRILQTTSSDYEDDIWGERLLGGTVEVTLDSTREGNSDSVTEVRLEPIGG